MTIARESPSQATGVIADAAASIGRAFLNNVQTGSLVVIVVGSDYVTNFVAGDCTKTAGTATLSAFTLDRIQNDGVNQQVAHWSAIVTAGGSLTVSVSTPGSHYSVMGINAYTGSWDSSRVEAGNGANFTTSTTPSSGNATSAGEALFVGGLAVHNGAVVTLTPGSSFASIFSSLDGTAHIVGDITDKIDGSGATEAASWTISVAPLTTSAQVVAYKEAGVSATADQEGARFGNDDGSESAHTFAAAQDSNVTAPLGANLLGRFLIDGTLDLPNTAYTLRYQKNGAGGYVAVPVGPTFSTPSTYFGGASGGTNPTTSTTITIPASLPANSVLSLHFTSRDHTSGTGQPIVTDNNGGAAWTQRQFSTDRKAQWWYKRVEANLSGKTITISGAVGSLSARLVVLQNVFATGDPFTDFVEESNASGNETHAAITPTNAGSAVVFAVYNYANDNTVTSVTAATTGAPGQSTSHVSTGGLDSGVHVAVWDNHPASSSGAITWAQTDGTTYSHVYAVKPLVTNNEIYVSPSSNITAGGEATTARLTAPSGKTTSDFVTGRRWDDENGSDSIDVTADDYTELEWCLQAQSPMVNGDYVDLRVYAGGSALAGYGVTPRWTFGTPTTFSTPIVPLLVQPAPRLAALLRSF